MTQQNSINMPGGFGGLTRFNESYKSKFNLRPAHVILFVILISVFRFVLPLLV